VPASSNRVCVFVDDTGKDVGGLTNKFCITLALTGFEKLDPRASSWESAGVLLGNYCPMLR
jgi:hypothetical protein